MGADYAMAVDCWCGATPDLTDIMPIYTHHSLDGRELVETREPE